MEVYVYRGAEEEDEPADPAERILFRHPASVSSQRALEICGPVAALVTFTQHSLQESLAFLQLYRAHVAVRDETHCRYCTSYTEQCCNNQINL